LFICALATLSFAQESQKSASIFVRDPAVFRQHASDLKNLKATLSNVNGSLDSLLQDANLIAEMNDKCGDISITEKLNEECVYFYQVKLPEFEENYMRITGDVRLGRMAMARGLEDRKYQIETCTEALRTFAQSKDQFLNLQGGVFLEPLTQGFQANYDFTLRYDAKHRQNVFEIAKKWGETCREMVVRQDGEGFAPYFLERLGKLNNELANSGSLAMYKTDTTATPTLYMDISKPVRSAYYLNGVKLFHAKVSAGTASESNVRIALGNNGVKVDGEKNVVKNGKAATFRGSVDYPEKSTKLNGRWIWENQGNNEGVDFGPEYDADSLANAQDASARERSAAEAAATENRRGVHPSLWVGVTGAFAPYANDAAYGYGLKKDDLFIMPDLAAAARAKLGFGENADASVAVGVGGMLGFAIGDGLERVYVAPLAQFELGYKIFGFRETAVFQIAGSNEEQWFQFRSGVFATFGNFGVELGHDLITNVGNGGYLTVFFEL